MKRNVFAGLASAVKALLSRKRPEAPPISRELAQAVVPRPRVITPCRAFGNPGHKLARRLDPVAVLKAIGSKEA